MTTVTKRPYIGETDLQLIAKLAEICEADGQLDEDTVIADLPLLLNAALSTTELNNPEAFSARRLWEDSNGNLIAFAYLWIMSSGTELDGYLYFFVHPRMRIQGLETQILNWGEAKLSAVGRRFGMRSRLHAKTRESALIRIAILESQGFARERSFLTMAISDLPQLPQPQLPDNFILRSVESDRDAQAWVTAFNESFIDHWDAHDLTIERFCRWQQDPHYKPEFDLVAVAPNQQIAAFCRGYLHNGEFSHSAQKIGWVRWLGTRRNFRKLGLGRNLLLATLQRLQQVGVETVKLGVDADSFTGATRLYESIGFHSVQTWFWYVKTVLR